MQTKSTKTLDEIEHEVIACPPSEGTDWALRLLARCKAMETAEGAQPIERVANVLDVEHKAVRGGSAASVVGEVESLLRQRDDLREFAAIGEALTRVYALLADGDRLELRPNGGADGYVDLAVVRASGGCYATLAATLEGALQHAYARREEWRTGGDARP
jgi:hypothetical protein